jgi:hypothetical protein
VAPVGVADVVNELGRPQSALIDRARTTLSASDPPGRQDPPVRVGGLAAMRALAHPTPWTGGRGRGWAVAVCRGICLPCDVDRLVPARRAHVLADISPSASHNGRQRKPTMHLLCRCGCPPFRPDRARPALRCPDDRLAIVAHFVRWGAASRRVDGRCCRSHRGRRSGSMMSQDEARVAFIDGPPSLTGRFAGQSDASEPGGRVLRWLSKSESERTSTVRVESRRCRRSVTPKRLRSSCRARANYQTRSRSVSPLSLRHLVCGQFRLADRSVRV